MPSKGWPMRNEYKQIPTNHENGMYEQGITTAEKYHPNMYDDGKALSGQLNLQSGNGALILWMT
jgi:hypothetical protein